MRLKVGCTSRAPIIRVGTLTCEDMRHWRVAWTVPSPSANLGSALMSHSHLTAALSSGFQLIINNALKSYQKHTKNDLLAHPLASLLQDCNSPADILAILQQQVQGLDQSRNNDERWTKCLSPTVNVLYTFSETLGERVSSVSLRK